MTNSAYFIDEPESAKQKYGIAGNAICRRAINFPTGASGLLPGHNTGLSEILKNFNPGDKAYIIGHASRQGHGSYDNDGLSRRRAKSVYDWLYSRVDPGAASIEVHAEADTAEIGTTPNDAKDRAVVVIVQSAGAPRPRILPGLPPIEPNVPKDSPDGPLQPNIPFPFRMSGWEIVNVWGTTLEVPTGIPNLSLGASQLSIQLMEKRTKRVTTYRMIGTAGSFGLFDPVAKFGKLKGILKELCTWKASPSGSTSDFKTVGTELVVTSWVPEPITSSAFAHYAWISSLSATVPSGNVLVLSRLPLNMPVVSEATIIAVGAFGGTGISLPGVSADMFMGTMDIA